MQAVFDLHCAPAEVLNLSEDDLAEETKGPNRALRTVYANRIPALVDLGLAPDLETATDLPLTEIVRRAAVMSADGHFAVRVGMAMAQRYPPFEPAQVVESRMYAGFPNRADESRMQAFHAAGWDDRAEIAETIEDDRYRELARRRVFMYAPEAIPTAQRDQLQTWLENRQHGREGIEAGRTISEAIEELNKDTTAYEAREIKAIRSWLQEF
ncbi:hypothetical protein [Falsihalocynthiibacter arcticus]|uniref:ExoI C-terminal domain-containing protein n=1 Tax=Falsihalocynthiibacter arcticus TaxID=1579316 RepID=A0A126UWT6_9RHOB|nr:hypothetical protein [Falsihalocynthiibacter arcticus]AML50185.1 hypothetical protein RC74_01905 [Falsihalocynthiibacter arcticus]